MRCELLERLKATALAPHLEEIAKLIRPAVRIQAAKCPLAELPLGAARFGGTPDVPRGFVWPTWSPPKRTGRTLKLLGPRDSAERRLNFLAQIDLLEMDRLLTAGSAADSKPKEESADAGEWLYFFYDTGEQPWGFDPADRDGARVMHHAGRRADLVRQLRDEPPADPAVDFPCCRLELEAVQTLPDVQALITHYLPDLPADQSDALAEGVSDAEPRHQFRGYPRLIQSPMELECQLASNGIYCGDPTGYEGPRAEALAPGAADWALLLQIDTDEDNPGWLWGDVGTLYFWIRRQDFKAREFGRTWTILQCY